ncbi:putative solute carrier family 35 member [Tolypocladium ophioglossoides CBS 100239]|uniref:Putative solute carrier family 35 member n=1 Tax=Tolypocladium ophioglossoides (strain CBS 100239) TaxID=1163406 RepID=A0A0L0N5C2_TOLOC|nr:putative solute carrier family 35 member [Tolypocladium ophioglossoides CBS 100239]
MNGRAVLAYLRALISAKPDCEYGYQAVDTIDNTDPEQDQDQDQDQYQDQDDTMSAPVAAYDEAQKGGFGSPVVSDNSSPNAAPPHHYPDDYDDAADNDQATHGLHLLEARSVHWYSYLTTADFWLVIGIGQLLALCITATNTFTSFLSTAHFNAPAFQTFFNYAFLAAVYNALFLARDGPRAWWRTARRDGWKYLLMAFLDVEGNYFTVLAYQYTNLLSAQLLNFWSIVCVVIVSFCLLKVRYKIPQVVGILVCCGGMGILLASDHMTGTNGGPGADMLKGDLFGLLGATLYGASNVLEEWLVSKAPMHHVLAFIGLLGMIFNGTQAAIFDRDSIAHAQWDGHVAAWLVGYTLCLALFYTLAPLILRMGSAAFFDISLLTANFWGVIIGVRVFGYTVHFLYPIAFVCIIVGLVIYFLSGSVLGDSRKPWLGANQEGGVAGIGTAKLRAINAARKAQGEPENGASAAAR